MDSNHKPETPQEIYQKRLDAEKLGVEEYLQRKLPFDLPTRFFPHFDGEKLRNAAEKPWRPGE